jgi:hypothetical protein
MRQIAQALVNKGFSVLAGDNSLHAQKSGRTINLVYERILGDRDYFYGWESFGSVGGPPLNQKHLLFKSEQEALGAL